MSDWAAFVCARLDEDEAGARFMMDREASGDLPRTEWLGLPLGERVLREVAAMRAIMDLSFSADENERAFISEHGNLEDYEYPLDGERIRRHLAGIWRDHPDYPQE